MRVIYRGRSDRLVADGLTFERNVPADMPDALFRRLSADRTIILESLTPKLGPAKPARHRKETSHGRTL
jgi:hypothetical protein